MTLCSRLMYAEHFFVIIVSVGEWRNGIRDSLKNY